MWWDSTTCSRIDTINHGLFAEDRRHIYVCIKNFHKELFGWDFGQMVEGCHVKEVEGRHKVTFSEVDSIKLI